MSLMSVGTESKTMDFSFSWQKSLSPDLVRLILARLPARLLARAACVCRNWRAIAEDPAVVVASFKEAWGLSGVVGRPSCPRFWGGGLGQFAIAHVLQRWDTLESLAVKYDVQVTEIRQLNHLNSDYGVYCRNRLLIPVTRPRLPAGKVCYIEFDEHAQCELAILYPYGTRANQVEIPRIESADTVQYPEESQVPDLQRITFQDLSSQTPGVAERSARVPDASTQAIGGVLYSEGSSSSQVTLQLGQASFFVNSNVEENQVSENSAVGIVQVEGEEESNGPLLTDDLWKVILELLPVPLLGRAACVCRLWRSIIADPAVFAAAFMAPWNLKEVVGRPVSSSFWRGKLHLFAISHGLQRQDTMAGLAVKYRVQVPAIRRLNNMMSDHGIHSRERLLIPVMEPELLEGQTCFIETDVHAKREVAVLYLDGTRPDRKAATLHATARAQRRLKREVLESLKRSLKVDDSTAQYYFCLAGGDLRGALQEFSEDVRWERGAE